MSNPLTKHLLSDQKQDSYIKFFTHFTIVIAVVITLTMSAVALLGLLNPAAGWLDAESILILGFSLKLLGAITGGYLLMMLVEYWFPGRGHALLLKSFPALAFTLVLATMAAILTYDLSAKIVVTALLMLLFAGIGLLLVRR